GRAVAGQAKGCLEKDFARGGRRLRTLRRNTKLEPQMHSGFDWSIGFLCIQEIAWGRRVCPKRSLECIESQCSSRIRNAFAVPILYFGVECGGAVLRARNPSPGIL